jgi:hypothetical protein
MRLQVQGSPFRVVLFGGPRWQANAADKIAYNANQFSCHVSILLQAPLIAIQRSVKECGGNFT